MANETATEMEMERGVENMGLQDQSRADQENESGRRCVWRLPNSTPMATQNITLQPIHAKLQFISNKMLNARTETIARSGKHSSHSPPLASVRDVFGAMPLSRCDST